MNNNEEELRLSNSIGTDHAPGDVRRNGIEVFCQSLPESMQGKIDSNVVDDSVEDIHSHERRLANHIIQYYSDHCALKTKVATVFYKTGKINIQIKETNDEEIVMYIPEKWTLFFQSMLVLSSTMQEDWDNLEQVGNTYVALLAHIDSVYHRGNLTPYNAQNTIDECIRSLESNFAKIANLSFAIFAFAICHELSHIVLNHGQKEIPVVDREIEADTHAYIMFLRLIQNYLRGNNREIAITECFQHYVVNAPQILLKLYATAHNYLLIVYGERQSQRYPDFLLRKQALFEMQKNMPTEKWLALCEEIDTTTLFNQDAMNFFIIIQEACDYFVEQTDLKKQRGKLDVLNKIDSGE